MILNDFTEPKLKFSREKLDAVLAELCGLLISKQRENPDFYGMVAAAVIDPKGQLATGVNYLYGNYRVHAERAAIDKYEEEYGELPKGSIVVTTLSPCSEDTGDNRYEESCTALLNDKRVKLAYCGYKDPTQDDKNDFTVIITDNGKIEELCRKFADTFLDDELCENFADGKKPGRKGLAKRSGVNCKQSVSKLRSIAAHSTGERQRMAHWCANMKSGKKKTNEETSKQILSYIKKVHPKGEFTIDQSITDHPEWELTNVPLASLHIESDDVSPYGQINWIDYDHVANITAQDIKAKPIVVDAKGWIIDGNHRAVAARDMGMTHIPAYVPVESEEDDGYETYDQHMARIKKEREQGIQEDKSFNQCYATACKLYDQAEAKGLEPKLVQVAGYKGDGSQANPKWLKMPQEYWQHYVTIVDDTVLDPTADQFGPGKATKYPVGQLNSEWTKQYQIRPKELDEVIHHPGIKTKTADSSGLVNKGEPVPAGKEQRLLGNLVGKLGAYEVYKWDKGTDSAYSVYDPKTRISQMTISGHNKAHHFEIFGIYGGPKAPIRAADLYAWLVKKLGLTLVSDKYQSPGGQRVWQELEQRYGRSVNVYAFNMKTNQPINTGADDPESTHGTRGDIAQNVRLVAAPK